MLKKEEISNWLSRMNITNYIIHDDLTVDVDGSVNLIKKNLTEIPIQFGIVKDFDCSHNQLTSLKGIPKKVDILLVENNRLTSLEYCPQEVDHFDCSHNYLSSLEYGPKIVHGDYYCNNNLLSDLIHMPKEIQGDFILGDNRLYHLRFNFEESHIEGTIQFKMVTPKIKEQLTCAFPECVRGEIFVIPYAVFKSYLYSQKMEELLIPSSIIKQQAKI